MKRRLLGMVVPFAVACVLSGCGDSKKREEGRAQLTERVGERLRAATAKADAYDFDGANAALRDLAEEVNKSPFADVATYDKLTADIEGVRRTVSDQETEYRKKIRAGWKVIGEKLVSPEDQARALAEQKRQQEVERARREREQARLAAEAKAEAEAREQERRRAELQSQQEQAQQAQQTERRDNDKKPATTLDQKTIELVMKYIEAEKNATTEEIARLEKECDDYSESIRRWRATKDATPKQKKEAVDTMKKVISHYREEIKELRDGKRTIPPTLPYAQLSVDDIGSFVGPFSDEFSFKVFQVIDETNFLMEIRFKGLDTIPMDEQVAVVWMRGLPTNRLADGKEMNPVGCYRVTGNQTYETVMGGRKTVYVVEPIDIEKLKAEVQRANAP